MVVCGGVGEGRGLFVEGWVRGGGGLWGGG